MSLDERILTILQNPNRKVNDLSEDETEVLKKMKTDIKAGLLKEIILSVKNYVQKEKNIRVTPGTIAEFILGCVSSSDENEEEEEDRDIFMVEDGKLSAVYSSGTGKADIHISDDSEINEAIISGLKSQGVKSFVFHHRDEANGRIRINNESTIVLLIVLLFFGAMWIYFYHSKI